MASWKWPNVLNKMLHDIPGINVLLNALLKQDVTGTTDVPAGAKQWVDTPEGKQFQVFNGQSWSSVGKLDHDAASVDGYDASPTVLKNTIPVRDANGDLPGNITGNAKTATKAGALSAVNPIEMGGTGANSPVGARQNLGTPPTDHSSTGTDYGLGNATEYGHNKLSDATDSDLGADGGTAATPKAVKTAKAEAVTAASEALTAFAEGQSQKDAAQDEAIRQAKSSAEGARTIADNALPKSGGTMTGAISFGPYDGIYCKDQYVGINANSEAGRGAILALRGLDDPTRPGSFALGARDNEKARFLEGGTDCSLTWCGLPVMAASMPKGDNVNVALQASGAEYTAPAAGYFCVVAKTTAAGGYLNINNMSASLYSISTASGANQNIAVYMPVKKNGVVRLWYSSATVSQCSFSYIDGEIL